MKKSEKKILKKKVSLGLMLFATILLIFLSNNTSRAKADYASSIKVDCFRTEEGYEHIIDAADWDVWYANNNSRHFIFANFTYLLAGREIIIYTDDFNYNLTADTVKTSFLISKHENSSLELEIERSVVGNDFSLSVDTDVIDLHVVPKSSSTTPIYPPVIEEEGEKEVIHMDFIDTIDYKIKKMSRLELIFWTALIVFLICICLFGLVRMHNVLFKHPIVVTGNTVSKAIWDQYIPKKQRDIDDTGREADYGKEIIKLGRYLTERKSTILDGYYELFFKHGKRFILKIHCADRYVDVNTKRQRDVNIIQKEHWFHEVVLLKIPKELQPDEERPKKTLKNKFLRYLARRFPSRRFPMKIDEILDKEKTGKKVTQLLLWDYIFDKEYVGFYADVKYQQKTPSEKDPDAKEDRPLLERVPWHKIELMARDPMIILNKEGKKGEGEKDEENETYIANKEIAMIPVDKEYRDHFKNSASMEKSKRAYLDAKYLKELKEKDETIEQLTLENLSLEKKATLKFVDSIKKFFKERIPSYAEFLDDVMPEIKVFGTIDDTKEKYLYAAQYRENLRRLENKIASFDDPNKVKSLDEQLTQAQKYLEKVLQGNGGAKSTDLTTLEAEYKKIKSILDEDQNEDE